MVFVQHLYVHMPAHMLGILLKITGMNSYQGKLFNLNFHSFKIRLYKPILMKGMEVV